ncbi:MAG: HNH endonuclease signature motif containing protein, partial [Actinomycetota bacterium]
PGTPAAPVPAPAGCADPPDASGRRRRYRPSAALARLVRARYRCCTYPGCARPADRCDLDHGRAWPLGPTCACNLHPLCRRHHRLKHSGHLHLHLGPDGTLTWTLRSGHFRTTGPPPVLARPTVPAARAAVTEDPPEPPPPPGHDAARWGARALRAVLQPPPGPAKAPPDDPGPPPF